MVFVKGTQKQRGKGGRIGEGEFKGMSRLARSEEQNRHKQDRQDLGSTKFYSAYPILP